MAAKPSRRRHRQNEPQGTRELILAEAMRLIARDGVEEMKVKDVADAVGIQTPSIYKHFENRDAIIAELSRNMVEELAQFLNPDPDLPPLAWLETWVKGLVWFYASRPAYVRMVLRDLATPGGFEPMVAALGPVEETANIDAVARFDDAFRAAYAKGVDAGVFQPIDHSTFYSMLFGAVLVSLAWPYSATRKPFGAAELDRLQSIAVAAALHLAKKI